MVSYDSTVSIRSNRFLIELAFMLFLIQYSHAHGLLPCAPGLYRHPIVCGKLLTLTISDGSIFLSIINSYPTGSSRLMISLMASPSGICLCGELYFPANTN